MSFASLLRAVRHLGAGLLLASGAAAFGAADASPPAAAADCPPAARPFSTDDLQRDLASASDRGFLWQIEKSGRRSYLYGTLHVAARDWVLPGPTVLGAIDASDTVALELDPLDPAVASRMQQAMAMRRPVVLPKALQSRLGRQMSAQCVTGPSLAALGPELQVATLSLLAGRRDGLAPEYGVDAFLAGFARNRGKAVVSLETPEVQLEAMQAGDATLAVRQIARGLDDLERGRVRPLLRRIGQIWADSDYAELERYESWCDCLRTPADRSARRRLLDDRNPGLAEAIDALHAGGTRVFAAVGSLHMTGPSGLPALLAERGYSVRRVVYPRR